jgi:hypothetical protein
MISPLTIMIKPSGSFHTVLEHFKDTRKFKDIIFKPIIVLLILPFFANISFRGYLLPEHTLSQMIVFGSVIIPFGLCYLLSIQLTEMLFSRSQYNIRQKIQIYFYSYAAWEIYWFFLTSCFFIFIIFSLFDAGITQYFIIFWVILFLVTFVWNFILNYKSFAVLFGRRRVAVISFLINLISGLFVISVYLLLIEAPYSFGWMRPGVGQ